MKRSKLSATDRRRRGASSLIIAAVCFAGISVGGIVPVAAGDGVIVFEQVPLYDGNTFSVYNCDTLVIRAAEVFVSNGDPIVGLAWWGAANSPTLEEMISSFTVEFWDTAAGDPCPETLLFSRTSTSYRTYEGYPWKRYELEFDTPFGTDEGDLYTLAVHANICVPDGPALGIHWRWAESLSPDGTFCYISFPPVDEWTLAPLTGEGLAFVLYSEMPTTPVLHQSWSRIKSRF